jgi:hypothetical protein
LTVARLSVRVNPFVAALVLWSALPAVAAAQDPPPKIGPFVVDVHGVLPLLPSDSTQLALSRGLTLSELPGRGFGVDVAAHVYLFRWRAVTVGLGAQAMYATSHKSPPEATRLRPVSETFSTVSPQLSLNFGNGNGWSYLSGGIGRSVWSVHPDASEPSAADRERLRTVNYGGGARWFAKKHLAFSFDVRFYGVDPGTPYDGRPGSPRTTLFVIGAGVSIR